MNQQIEIEFKNLLTKDEFQRVKNHFQLKESDFIKQRNYYFDTPLFSLAKQKSALRIREKANEFELTLKQPYNGDLLETNHPLSKDEAFAFIRFNRFPESALKFRQLITSIQVDPTNLTYLGELVTNRTEMKYKNGLIALDHSQYLGIEDYEIEYEVQQKSIGYQTFLHLLSSLQIEKKATPNKIKRFFTEKQRQNL